MRNINTSILSDECWAIQINGSEHCENCKFVGLSACKGQDIRRTGKNKKGFLVGRKGLSTEYKIT